MAMHLFSTPVECAQCGTVVDDPNVDKCPNCGTLLKERRTPRRLAGVEKRYEKVRFLMGLLRFLGVVTFLVGALLFFFSDPSIPWTVQLATVTGGLIVAVSLFVIAGLFELAMDIEENTRASFRVQQMILQELEDRLGTPTPPGAAG